MTSREQFIGTVRKALGGTKAPPGPWPYNRLHSVHTDIMNGWTRDELARTFVQYSRIIGAAVSETTRNALNGAIRDAVLACAPGPVILANDSLLNELDTATALGGDIGFSRYAVYYDTGSRSLNIGSTFY